MQPLLEVRRYRRETLSHCHDFHQVVLPVTGYLQMVIEGQPGRVSASCVALVNAGHVHSFTGSAGNAFLVLDVPTTSAPATDTPNALLWQHARRAPFVTIEDQQARLIRSVADAAHRGLISDTLVSHACSLLLGVLANQLGLNENGATPPGLRTVIAYIDSHLEWPLDVAELAAIAHVSTGHLHTLFRQYLDTTPRQFVTARRLERARELLARSTLSIADVAQRSGYSDQAAFARAFRRHQHETPLAFRLHARRNGTKLKS